MSKKSPESLGNDPARTQSRWSLRGSSLRFKMSVAVAIPMVVAASLGGLRVADDVTQARNYSASASQVTVLAPAIDYLTAVEAATVAAQKDSKSAQALLASSVTSLKRAADELLRLRDTADLTPQQRHAVNSVLDLSRALREDTKSLSAETWLAQSRQLQAGTTKLIGSLIDAQLEPEPRLELLSQALAGRFSLAMQQALGAADRTGETGSLELYSELGVEAAAIDRLDSSLDGSEEELRTLRTDNSQRFRAVRTGRGDLGGPDAYTPYDTVIQDLTTGIDRQLATSADAKRTAGVVNALITVAAFVAAVLLALLVSHLFLDPIRKVRDGTASVATELLPREVAAIRAGEDAGEFVPINVDTSEEIGQLARAVDDLHRQAIHLASGEAEARAQVDDMFVTLSRRNTTLVNQQLDLIASLEQDEEDPRRLESLFRLDHLASRMRRTADSLLILGNAPSRPGDQAALTVAEALHAGIAGVLDYDRVRVGAAPELPLAPAAAADVVHLLTELVDNALAFSPPTAQVELNGYERLDGVDIEVVDAGLGIPPTELTSLNQTLAHGAQISSETARRMGLFVVSRLAQRHGINVHLSRNGRGGTTARVQIPSSLLTGPAAGDRLLDAARPAATGGHTTAQLPPTPRGLPALGNAGAPPAPLPRLTEAAPVASLTPLAPAPAVVEESAPAAVESAPAAPAAPAPVSNGLPQRRPGGTPDLPGRRSGAVSNTFVPGSPVLPAVTNAFGPSAPAAAGVVEEAPAPRTAPSSLADAFNSRMAALASLDTAEEGPDGVLAAGSTSEEGAAEEAPADPAPAAADETPMFKNLNSSWFSAPGESTWAPSEVEKGWDRAGEVAQAPVDQPTVTDSGLPVRRPGARLVPGSVTPPPAEKPVVDPEAIRSRLAAHAAGVSRGRRTLSTTPLPSTIDSADQEAGTA